MELRGYFFGNMYLSSIQQGVQAKHCGDEMVVEYLDPVNVARNFTKKGEMLFEYLAEHKTVILLNAGFSSEIRDLWTFFATAQNPYPYAKFNEAGDALDGAITCVGIILPEKIFNAAKAVREGHLEPEAIMETGKVFYMGEDGMISHEVSQWEYQLIMRLNNYGMAK